MQHRQQPRRQLVRQISGYLPSSTAPGQPWGVDRSTACSGSTTAAEADSLAPAVQVGGGGGCWFDNGNKTCATSHRHTPTPNRTRSTSFGEAKLVRRSGLGSHGSHPLQPRVAAAPPRIEVARPGASTIAAYGSTVRLPRPSSAFVISQSSQGHFTEVATDAISL